MLISYARVSTTDQKSELQIDALLKAGIDRRHLFEDRMSGLICLISNARTPFTPHKRRGLIVAFLIHRLDATGWRGVQCVRRPIDTTKPRHGIKHRPCTTLYEV
jgi:hypothetical protein